MIVGNFALVGAVWWLYGGISQGSPVPSPVLPGKQSNPVVDKEKGKEKQDQPTPPSTHGEESSKDKEVKKNVNVTLVTPPTDGKEQNNTSKEDVKEKVKEKEDQEEEKEKKNEKAEGDGEQKEEEKEKENEKAEEKDEQKEKEKEDEKAKKEDEQKEKENEKAKKEDEQIEKEPVGSDESCDGMERRCRDLKSMVACIKSFDHGNCGSFLSFQLLITHSTPWLTNYNLLVIYLKIFLFLRLRVLSYNSNSRSVVS